MADVTYYFSIPDIICINCIAPIENALRACNELSIKNLKVSLDKTLQITIKDVVSFEDTKKIITNTLDDIGYECLDRKRPKSFFEKFRHWFFASLGVLSGIGLLIFNLIMPIPAFLLIPFTAVSIILTLIIGSEFYLHGFKNLFKSKTLTMDLLFSISTITTIVVTVCSFFVPWLSPLLDAGLLIFGFRHLGLAIEELIKDSMKVEKTFVERLPKKILVQHGTTKILKPIEELEIGDVIYIKPAGLIPVDGLVIKEDACSLKKMEIYDTIKTGSPWPREVSHNEPVFSGMQVAQGRSELKLRVTAKLYDSYSAKLDKQILNIEEQKHKSKTIAEKILKFFIPSVILIALISATVISFLFPVSLAINCAITVLVSACPCTLGLIIPLAETIGWNKAKLQGVYFKDTAALQKANNPEWILFDFNGTITTGLITISDIISFDENINKDTLLALFQAVEGDSRHPIAKAIKQYIDEQKINTKNILASNDNNYSICVNEPGLIHNIDGITYTVGNIKMMQSYGIRVPDFEKKSFKPGDGIIYLARNKKILGCIIITDPIRPKVKNIIANFINQGIKVGGITGADKETAERIADEVGIDKNFVFAECRGGDAHGNAKAKLIKELPGRKIFVGDRENDEAAFKAADFSIAIESLTGNEDTQGKADAVIPRFDLLPCLFEISKQTTNNVKQNLIFSFCYNLLTVAVASGILIGIGFTINPAIGALLMIIQSTLILCNAIRFQHQKLKSLEKISKEEAPTHEFNESYKDIQSQLYLKNHVNNQMVEETKLEIDKTADIEVEVHDVDYDFEQTHCECLIL